jgi:hypothetical protein
VICAAKPKERQPKQAARTNGNGKPEAVTRS